MLKTAEYLDKAIQAEAAAFRAHSPELAASFTEIANAWRRLAETSDRHDRPFEAEARVA